MPLRNFDADLSYCGPKMMASFVMLAHAADTVSRALVSARFEDLGYPKVHLKVIIVCS